MSIFRLIKETNLKWLISAALISIFLWQAPGVAWLLYPVQLFVTYVHEAGHALAALLTGGEVLSITVETDTSGLTWSRGGFRPLIISAGYLGSSLFGGLMLLAAFKKGREKLFLWLLAGFFLIFTLLYARNLVSIATGLGAGLLFLGMSRYQNHYLSLFLAFLGIQSSFYALKDIYSLFLLSQFTSVRTDAQSMSLEIFAGLLPASVWALAWGGLSLVLFGLFLKIAFAAELQQIKLQPGPKSIPRPRG